MKEFATISLLLVLAACGRSPAPEPALVLGPRATAVEIAALIGQRDARLLLPRSTGRMKEVLEEIVALRDAKDRLCAALLDSLEAPADRSRVERLRASMMTKLVWSAPGVELEGVIECDEHRGRFRLAAIDASGARTPRVMVLERSGERWLFAGFDEGPTLDTVIRVRNQFNEIRYRIDVLLRDRAAAPSRSIDPAVEPIIGLLEQMSGVR